MQVFLSLIVGSFLLQSFAASASLQTVHQDDGSNGQMTIPDKHQPDEEGIKTKLAEEPVNTGKETQPPPSNPIESKQSADENEVSAPVVTDSNPVTIPPVLKKESFRHCIKTSTGNTFKWCLIEKRPEGCPPQSYDTLNALFKGHFCSGGGGDSAVAKPEQVTTTNPTAANHHFMQFIKTFESFLGNAIGLTLDEVKKLDSFETQMVDIMNELHKIRENITQELLSENQDAAGTKADEPKNVNEQEKQASPLHFRSLGTQSNQSNHEEKVEEPMPNHKRPHPWVDNPFDLETETKVLDELNIIKKADEPQNVKRSIELMIEPLNARADVTKNVTSLEKVEQETPDKRFQDYSSDNQSNQSNHEEKVEEPMATHPIVPPLDKPKNQTIVEETETKVHDETKAVPINDPSKPISASDPRPSSTSIDAQIDTKNGLEEGQQKQENTSTPDQRQQEFKSDISKSLVTQSNQSNHEEKVEDPMTNLTKVPINDPSKPISESDPKPSSAIDAQINTKSGLEEGQQDVDVMTDNLGQVAGRENKKDVQEIHSA